jgi:hypothetical protein
VRPLCSKREGRDRETQLHSGEKEPYDFKRKSRIVWAHAAVQQRQLLGLVAAVVRVRPALVPAQPDMRIREGPSNCALLENKSEERAK